MTSTEIRPPEAPEPIRATLQRLASAQKGAAGAPAYSRFVNRGAGRLLAALAHRAGLTPDQVTAVSAALTFSGIGLLVTVPPSWGQGIAVAACLLLGYALDSADGQLARLRGGGSPAGEWLDHMVDATKSVSLHLAIAVALYRFVPADRGWPLLLPLGFAVVGVVHLFAMLLNEQLRRNHGRAERAAPTAERPSVLRSLVVLPTDYGVLGLAFVLFGAPSWFLADYTLLFLASTGYLLLALGRWFREMRGLTA
ncbi:CDP-alcohol phosphatidyltransferase family protein [Geodermatophilus sp. SYSU D00815]